MRQDDGTSATNASAVPQSWRGREAIRVANGAMACTLLRNGGSIAEVRLREPVASHNLLWESPWFEPAVSLTDEELAARYGDVNSGRYLHHYTGHTLCLDGFGPASPSELAMGGGLHGEAIQCEWQSESSGEHLLRLEATLPGAGLAVERAFTLLPGECVLRVCETVRNLGATSRNIHWVQHATVGPPAFPAGARISTSACEGLTWPLDYEGRNALARDAAFTWPHAPGSAVGAVDLGKLFDVQHSGFVAALKQPANRPHGFVAAHDPAAGLVLAYVFRTEDFPWLTLWEENCCRTSPPWNGEVQARGLEFGTTPFPLGNDVADAQGPVLGARTSYPLAAGACVTAPWLIVAARLPSSYTCIDDLHVEADALAFISGEEQFLVPAVGIAKFLAPDEGARA